MAVAQSIFNLNEWLQLFWAAVDMALTLLALKVAIGLEKNYFWVFQKINHKHSLNSLLAYTCLLNAQQSIFLNLMTTFKARNVKAR